MPHLEVALLPDLIESPLAGRTAVVIDVLRATTTVTWALANGCSGILACVEIDQARQAAATWRREHPAQPPALLGGERQAKIVEGFDCGNSPSDYSAERVQGRTVVFTTTNGTRAMNKCAEANTVLLAAFVNLSAVVRRLLDVVHDDVQAGITIVCAGTDGAITLEDTLVAGEIVDALLQTRQGGWHWNDQATLARDAWRADTERPLDERLRASQGGRNLHKAGHEADIPLAADKDRFDVIGIYDAATGWIRSAPAQRAVDRSGQ